MAEQQEGSSPLFAIFFLSIYSLLLIPITIWRLCAAAGSEDVVKPWEVVRHYRNPLHVVKLAFVECSSRGWFVKVRSAPCLKLPYWILVSPLVLVQTLLPVHAISSPPGNSDFLVRSTSRAPCLTFQHWSDSKVLSFALAICFTLSTSSPLG